MSDKRPATSSSRHGADETFSHLFSAFTLGSVTLKNRIFVPGHMTMMVDNGVPNADQAAYYEARARGGAAMIVTEAAAVHPTAVRSGRVIDATRDDCVPGYTKIVDAVRGYDCVVLGQLFHPGREIKHAADGSLPVTYSASAERSDRFHVTPSPMSPALIADVVTGYGESARRLYHAGLTGVEQHRATTFAEDLPLVESVQRGLGSRGYKPRMLMVDDARSLWSEHAVAHLQSLVLQALNEHHR